MSNPDLEVKVRELLDQMRMKEELETEISAAEDEIKKAMGDEEALFVGAFTVSRKAFTSSRIDTSALNKTLPDVAVQFMKRIATRSFSIH